MSHKSALECLRSGSNVKLNSSILSGHLSLVDHILLATVTIQGTVKLCADTGLHLFLCLRIKDGSVVFSNPLLHVGHAAVGDFYIVPIQFAMEVISGWK